MLFKFLELTAAEHGQIAADYLSYFIDDLYSFNDVAQYLGANGIGFISYEVAQDSEGYKMVQFTITIKQSIGFIKGCFERIKPGTAEMTIFEINDG
ncbi:MAG: hypothetical protein AAGJ95_11875 [Cyanobacteria bacterium J06554_11]